MSAVFLSGRVVATTNPSKSFLIEDGKVTSPVVNFRFNESPVRLLRNTIALGTPVRVASSDFGGMIAPPLVAKDFTFASISDAV